MEDVSQRFLEGVQRGVRQKQARMPRQKLRGKYVRRNGVTYLVVAIRGERMVVSDVKTPPEQVQVVSTKAFLSKKVTVLGGKPGAQTGGATSQRD